jgi:iron complex outermembrane receptor protein
MDFESEELLAYELGARGQPADWLSWDLSLYYHDYDELRSAGIGTVIQPGFPIILPGLLANDLQAETYGGESWTKIDLQQWWRVYVGYACLFVNGATGADGSDPRNQAYLQSSWDVGQSMQLDAIWRYVDNIVFQNLNQTTTIIPHYHALDLRLAWRDCRGWELALVGRNLLDAAHPEYKADTYLGNTRTEVQREVYGMLTWLY